MRKLDALKTKFPLWLRVVLTSTRSVLDFLQMCYYFLAVVFTPSFGPRVLVVDCINPRFNPHLIRGGFFLYTGRVLHVDSGAVVFRFAYLVLLPPPTICQRFDTTPSFFYKILRALLALDNF